MVLMLIATMYQNNLKYIFHLSFSFLCYNDFRPKSQGPRRSERIIKKNIMQLEMKSQLSVEVIKLNIEV